MAKNMARIKDGVVVNIEWRSNVEEDSDTLIDIKERLVDVGDSYESGEFYRDGVRIITPLEETQAKLITLQEESSAIQSDTDAMLVDYEYRLTMLELGITE